MNTVPHSAQEGNTPFVTIPLNEGYSTIVDPEDADLAKWHWRVSRGYACRGTENKSRGKFNVSMHRVILERKLGRPIQQGLLADHINRNKLDNRRENLREVTHRQSVLNRSSFVRMAHGYTGLKLERRKSVPDKWSASLRTEGQVHYLGSYATPKEASLARDKAMLEKYGEFVRLNNSLEEVLAWQIPSPSPRQRPAKRGLSG